VLSWQENTLRGKSNKEARFGKDELGYAKKLKIRAGCLNNDRNDGLIGG